MKPVHTAAGAPDLRRLVPPGVPVLSGDPCAEWAVRGASPKAVAFPETVEQAATVIERSAEAGIRVAPAGAGTWIAARGRLPADLIVSTARMDHVSRYEPADLTLTAGAGIELAALASRTARHRQWLALDPPGRGTLGGLVATASAGPLQAGYGTPREHVLGATLITGDGRVLDLGGQVVKNVAGFDLLKAVVGGWGAYGLVTSVTVRLHPLPEADVSLVYRTDLDSALDLARRLAEAALIPAALDLIYDASSPDASGRADPTALVCARVLGSARTVAAAAELLEAAAGQKAHQRVEGPASASLAERTRAAGSAGAITVRVKGLPTRVAELVRVLPKQLGGHAAGLHVTTGVLRVAFPAATALTELGRLADLSADNGVSVNVLDGPAEADRFDRPPPDPVTARLLGDLRALFDPAGVLRPTDPTVPSS